VLLSLVKMGNVPDKHQGLTSYRSYASCLWPIASYFLPTYAIGFVGAEVSFFLKGVQRPEGFRPISVQRGPS